MSYSYVIEENGRKLLRIPSEVQLDEGKVELEWKDGCVIIKPVELTYNGFDYEAHGFKKGDVRALEGFIKWDGPPITQEQMDEAIAEACAEGCK